MIKEIKDFKRIDIFNHYHQCDNPFIILTTSIDVTNVINYCKKNKMFYATLGYIITKTTNQIDAFKYRYSNSKFYYCDELASNYTQMFDDETIGYFSVPYNKDINIYRNEFTKVEREFKEKKKYDSTEKLDEIWLSCSPWFSFNSLISPFNKKITIPQFIWDKYELKNDKYYINLMIMIHHGFADGLHISRFINKLKENINSLKI